MAKPERVLSPNLSAAHRFGYELRRLRKAQCFSLTRLAATIHVSSDLVQKVETAERKPHIDFAQRCDRALGARGLLVALWQAVEQEQKCDCPCHQRIVAVVQELNQQGLPRPFWEDVT